MSILGTVGIASGFANAQNSPKNAQSRKLVPDNMRPRLLLPEIPPDEVVEYVVLPLGTKITGRLGLPAAQLIDIPAELAQEIAVWVPQKNIESLPPDAIGTEFTALPAVRRYTKCKNTIFS